MPEKRRIARLKVIRSGDTPVLGKLENNKLRMAIRKGGLRAVVGYSALKLRKGKI